MVKFKATTKDGSKIEGTLLYKITNNIYLHDAYHKKELVNINEFQDFELVDYIGRGATVRVSLNQVTDWPNSTCGI